MSYVGRVFTSEREESVEALMGDESIRQRILFYGGRELKTSREISIGLAFDQILALTYQIDFAREDEKVYVSSLIRSRIGNLNFLPFISEQRGIELAERCFISTCFFWDYLEERSSRKASPPPEFYSQVGREIFDMNGRYDISRHLPEWQKYWGEILDR